jgi:hypothetical protein
MIAANFRTPVSLALHALLGRLGPVRGHRVSVQEAMREMLIDYFKKYDEIPPADLTETDDDPAPDARAASARRSGRPVLRIRK